MLPTRQWVSRLLLLAAAPILLPSLEAGQALYPRCEGTTLGGPFCDVQVSPVFRPSAVRSKSRLPCGLEATSVAMLCVVLCGQLRVASWDVAGRVGGGDMTQLAVSVILVAQANACSRTVEEDEAGCAGVAGSVNGRGCWQWPAVLGMAVWKMLMSRRQARLLGIITMVEETSRQLRSLQLLLLVHTA